MGPTRVEWMITPESTRLFQYHLGTFTLLGSYGRATPSIFQMDSLELGYDLSHQLGRDIRSHLCWK